MLCAVLLQFVDDSVGQLVEALKQQGLLDCTYIVVTAKHGQVSGACFLVTVRHFDHPLDLHALRHYAVHGMQFQ